ncbi:aprataxin and PNK-like factor [Microplitis demolitor]|uniref:aprataxin and PNK-like factor n=1 Tax=Microplitis demolitor TaxID=69319 RepID=UPI0004CCF32F|nr:aprataxin and PNK-like factor [Microplitis demolitor]
MEKKNTEMKRKSQSSNEEPPDKKARVDIKNILLPSDNKDLSSHSIHDAPESSNTSKICLPEPNDDPTSSNVDDRINGVEINEPVIEDSQINDSSDHVSSEINSETNKEDEKNSIDKNIESVPTVHQSTSIEEVTGIRVPCVNTEDKLIECKILNDNNDKKIKWNDKNNLTSTDLRDDSNKNNQDPQTSTNSLLPRNKCIYGAECFRTSSEHKAKYSHPGDTDFEVKDNRPECQYGTKCYRKNPQHLKDYKHTIVRRKRRVTVDQVQLLKKDKNDDKDSGESSFEESVDESEYGPSDLDSSEDENEFDDDSDW